MPEPNAADQTQWDALTNSITQLKNGIQDAQSQLTALGTIAAQVEAAAKAVTPPSIQPPRPDR